ncbi:MAG: efflux RND transporter permease subunit [Wenzhouxiangellaceae bacterium]|nr:efflux RND transporter permease subunit [Wenzhouxiangellaceae bacterium]
MNAIFFALERRRLILAAVILLSVLGGLAWFGMNRQEDPFFPYRYGQIVAEWPGAAAAEVERLVLNPIEEELAQVEEVDEIIGTARLGLANVQVRLHPHIYDTDAAWDRIRVAMGIAERKFPPGVSRPDVRDRSMDTHAIVLAISGDDDLLVLLDAARQLRRELFRMSEIARIEILADPGEQLLIQLDPARAAALGIAPEALAAQLDVANRTLAGGTLDRDGRSLVLDPITEFSTLDELRAKPIRTDTGALLPLGEIAEVTLAAREPATERMWVNGRPSIGLGIVIPDNRLNTVRFGEQLRALVDELRPGHAPLEIHELFYQPVWVERRLSELGRSLATGVGIVALVLLLFMGPRLGLLVASLLPLVTFSALAVYAVGGGVLHQIAIAGMVIALGMLVDNAIVMVENLQWHLDRGANRVEACGQAVRELAGPLAAATGTTLAAFTPLLLAAGNTADFTRGIPIMVMITLVVSYFYAMLVTPILGAAVLRPEPGGAGRMQVLIERLGRSAAALSVRHPIVILACTVALIAGSLTLARWLPQDFFPSTDRNQLLVDLRFPEGTRTTHTALMARGLAEQLRTRDKVQEVHVFAGFSGPRFFYNLAAITGAPHLARLVVIAESEHDLPELIAFVRAQAAVDLPQAETVAHRLGQGPAIDAPIELRVFGEGTAELQSAAETLTGLLRQTPGAADVRHTLGTGIPMLEFAIDDAEATRFGTSREQIGQLLADATLGRDFSVWRPGREPVPMRIRSPEGERFPVHALAGLSLATDVGPVPLAQFVTTRVVFEPAVIEHRDLQRLTRVLAETEEGVTYNQVLERVLPRVEQSDLPDGVRIDIGGAAAEAGDANSALYSALPIGMLLLLVFLLWQFNSFRLVTIVLVTVPLATIGVVPGLLLTGQTFSFTAILGVVALVGIVVNNAIVLIDVAEQNRRAGDTIDSSIADAVVRRTRPILMTTATTIVGLTPLTLTQSTLWPPLAWAIISGLISSTALTLLVVPVLYRLMMRIRRDSLMESRRG